MATNTKNTTHTNNVFYNKKSYVNANTTLT